VVWEIASKVEKGKKGKREKGYQNEFYKMLAATYIEFSSEI
jgi:hypothetical protein